MLPGILFLPEMPFSQSLIIYYQKFCFMGDAILSINSYLGCHFPCLQFTYSAVLTWDAILSEYSLPTVLFLPGMPFSPNTVYLQCCFYLGCHFLRLEFTYSSVFTWEAIFFVYCLPTVPFVSGMPFSLYTDYLQFCFHLGCHIVCLEFT